MEQTQVDPIKEIRSQVRRFLGDYKRVFHASKGLAVFLLVVSVYLGLLPVLQLGVSANGLDAVIGGRGVGIMTADINKYYMYQVVILLSLLPVFVFCSQLKGVVARLARETAFLTLVATVGYVSIASVPVTALVILAFTPAFFYIKNKWVRWTMSSIMLLLLIQPLEAMIRGAVFKDVTVGEMVWISGALIAFGVALALRPHLYAHHH